VLTPNLLDTRIPTVIVVKVLRAVPALPDGGWVEVAARQLGWNSWTRELHGQVSWRCESRFKASRNDSFGNQYKHLQRVL
jgi:hypothetical protein